MLSIELFCPLHCLVISTLRFPQLSKLISFQVHQLFGPLNLLWSPAHVRRVRRFWGPGITKLSRSFQIISHFPDSFETVRIFPDHFPFSRRFQICAFWRTLNMHSLAMSWEANTRFLCLLLETVSRALFGKFLCVKSCYPESFGFLRLWEGGMQVTV